MPTVGTCKETSPEPANLSEAGLLQRVVHGSRDAETLEAALADRGLAELSREPETYWHRTLGVTPTNALRLACAFELGRRVERSRRERGAAVRGASDVYALLACELRGRRQEVFVALLLDGKHCLRRIVEVSSGTLSSSLVHPREVFGPAVGDRSGAVVVCHNHPSGDPEPSSEDVEVTRRLLECGRLLGIPLLDHVVIGDGCYRSLRERLDFDS